MELERRSGETDFEYHKRLVYGKLVDKTLADIDYSELAELVYGKPYSSDVARRMMYGSKFTVDLVDRSGINQLSSEALSDIDEKIIELQKERKRISDQRREFSKVISSDARWDHLKDVIRSSAETLQPLGCMIVQDKKLNPWLSDGEAVLVFSDWHYGMTTNNVFNTYDTDICKERVNHIIHEASSRIVLNSCKKLHIIVLGDLIHGNCHVSARVASEEVAVEQLMHASELLAQAICDLSQYVDETYVYVTYGNHARAVPNKQDSIHKDNMERFIPWWLEQRLKPYQDIHVVEGDTNEFLFINACGHDICAAHGDLDTVRTSPRILTALFNKKYGKNVEYILLGDKHHRESFEELGVTSMVCGSLCGADDYASDRRLYSEPSQLLLIVTPECGVDAEYRLRCR